ncbi:MAG: hypothetical protein KGJ80_03545 [Chloroflexota bacterium]|nr:hypothetical protein [Chloroflexota bacterium]
MLDILSARVSLARESWGEFLTDVVPVAVEFNSFKLKLVLINGSTLRIEEHYSQGVLGRYAYYLLDPQGNLIVGWDNAPHHIWLPNFPHHKHIGRKNKREPSFETTLEDVLAIVKKQVTATS